jgi:hypothetical protein
LIRHFDHREWRNNELQRRSASNRLAGSHLARKEKALAEAAVLLVLKKTIDSYYKEEDDDTDAPSEK